MVKCMCMYGRACFVAWVFFLRFQGRLWGHSPSETSFRPCCRLCVATCEGILFTGCATIAPPPSFCRLQHVFCLGWCTSLVLHPLIEQSEEQDLADPHDQANDDEIFQPSLLDLRCSFAYRHLWYSQWLIAIAWLSKKLFHSSCAFSKVS
jgi:hypothetical protein